MKTEHIICISLVFLGAVAIIAYKKSQEQAQNSKESFWHPWRVGPYRRVRGPVWWGRPGWRGYTLGYGYPYDYLYGGWPPRLYSY